MLQLEHLPDRINPASLDVTGGILTFTANPGETNNVTVSVTGTAYAFNDSANKITLTPGAMAAGFKGSGTFTVSGQDSKVNGIVVSLGDGDDTFNLRSVNDPISILGGDDADTVNISSNAPNNTGNLLGILAAVAVDAEVLVVSDLPGNRRATLHLLHRHMVEHPDLLRLSVETRRVERRHG